MKSEDVNLAGSLVLIAGFSTGLFFIIKKTEDFFPFGNFPIGIFVFGLAFSLAVFIFSIVSRRVDRNNHSNPDKHKEDDIVHV
ncbi:MAG: hypothetical protein LBJ93_01710 [Clostridiales bacterium]|jgi:hypothetical protein|nr:hypothetical protein [Clostridiales bacterium]